MYAIFMIFLAISLFAFTKMGEYLIANGMNKAMATVIAIGIGIFTYWALVQYAIPVVCRALGFD